MKQILISDEAHRAAKTAAASDGLPLFRWIEKTIRAVCGLAEFSLGGESGTNSATVHEINLESRLSASIKQADARKEKP